MDTFIASVTDMFPSGMVADAFESEFITSGGRILGLQWWKWLLVGYVMVELAFVFVVYKIWLPRLNKPKDHPIIRNSEHHSQRHKLFERMLRRQEVLCDALEVDKKLYFTEFIRNWFFYGGENEDIEEDSAETLACIRESGLPCKADIDKLLAWGYFQCNDTDMTEEWQQKELANIYAMIKDSYDMEPGPRTKQKLVPVTMTIEDLDLKYRPLCLYFCVFFCQAVMAVFLYCMGFSYHVTSTGLQYWYRPAKRRGGTNSSTQPESLPFLFFHGIAPAGNTFYIPMILAGMATDDKGAIDRPIFLFRNPGVAFNLTDHAPTEKETIDGVWEAVDKHLSPTAEVSISGHSFGTCLQTYLLHSSQGHRVRQLVLIDPVSICLSDPDVITNFVYCRGHHRDSKLHDSVPDLGSAGFVMNELFIEHFLRRQFAWYNGELFLEDIPDHCKVIVCLSDRDEILNAQKVRCHVDIYNGDAPRLPKCMRHLKESHSPATSVSSTRSTSASSTRVNPTLAKGSGSTLSSSSSGSSTTGSLVESVSGKQKLDVIYWEGEGMGHGSILFNPTGWEQIRRAMHQQERQILKTKSL